MFYLIGIAVIIAITLLSIEVKLGKMIKQNEQIVGYLSKQTKQQKVKPGIYV